MNKSGSLLLAVMLILGACGNEREQLVAHEQACQKALDLGLLEIADKECSSALDVSDSDDRDLRSQSEWLFRLGSIKRQRSLFAEAETLIKQSLVIEQSLPDPDPLAITRRHHELCIVLTGQEKWQEGVVSLERVLANMEKFSAKEQKAIVNMSRIYVSNLKKSELFALAEKIETHAQKIQENPSEHHLMDHNH